MNLRKNLENTLSSLLTHYGDSLTLFGEMVEVSHRQTPRKDCDAKAPRQDSTISGFRLGIAVPKDRAASCTDAGTVSVSPYLPLRDEDGAPEDTEFFYVQTEWQGHVCPSLSETLSGRYGVPFSSPGRRSPLLPLPPVRASIRGGQGTINSAPCWWAGESPSWSKPISTGPLTRRG